MLKIVRPFIILLCFIVIAGCQQTEKTSQHKKTSSPKKEAAAAQEKKPTFDLTGEGMLQEPGGDLFQKYVSKDEFAKNDVYVEAQDEAVNEYIQTIKKEDTKNWSPEQWAESLITAFRTDYKITLQPMKDYEVKYDKLKLPDGRLLQDVTEEELHEQSDKVNVALLLDASGSMKSNVPGGNKMQLAKSSLSNFAQNLPEKTNVSLTVLGHKGTGSDKDKKLSCGSVETVYPLNSYDKNKFSSALNKFNASGWTPLASAIQKAEKQLLAASDEHTKNFIYVVSDGIETCSGNPVQAAKDAKASNMNIQINIIGFDVDNEADRQLKEVAKAGGGEYTSVRTKQQLLDEVAKNWREAMGKTTWRFWVAGNNNNINWDSVGMSQQLQGLYNNNITARNRESDRLNTALNKLLENRLIDFEKKSAVSNILFKRSDSMREYSDTIWKTKHQEIFDTADRLKKIIDDVTMDLDL